MERKNPCRHPERYARGPLFRDSVKRSVSLLLRGEREDGVAGKQKESQKWRHGSWWLVLEKDTSRNAEG